jgi:hypothetical protein
MQAVDLEKLARNDRGVKLKAEKLIALLQGQVDWGKRAEALQALDLLVESGALQLHACPDLLKLLRQPLKEQIMDRFCLPPYLSRSSLFDPSLK